MALEKQKKLHIARCAVLAVLLVIFSVLQNTKGFFPEIMGVRAVLLIPAAVSVAMYERELAGMFFGLFAGTLWDISASGNNFYAAFLLVVGFVCGLLINSVLRKNIITSTILSGLWLLIYFAGSWFFRYVVGGLDLKGYMFVRFYLPAFAYSFLLSPVIFLIIREAENLFTREQ